MQAQEQSKAAAEREAAATAHNGALQEHLAAAQHREREACERASKAESEASRQLEALSAANAEAERLRRQVQMGLVENIHLYLATAGTDGVRKRIVFYVNVFKVENIQSWLPKCETGAVTCM